MSGKFIVENYRIKDGLLQTLQVYGHGFHNFNEEKRKLVLKNIALLLNKMRERGMI